MATNLIGLIQIQSYQKYGYQSSGNDGKKEDFKADGQVLHG